MKRNRNIRRIIVAAVITVITVLVTVSARNLAYANADSATVTKKVVYPQMGQCLQNDYFVEELRVEQLSSVKSMFKTGIIFPSDAEKDVIILPTNYGHSVSGNKMSCVDLFAGTSGWTGIATSKFSSDDKGHFLESFGYVKKSEPSGDDMKKCLTLNYKHEGVSKSTEEVCFTVEEYEGQYHLPENFDSYTIKYNEKSCSNDELCTFVYRDDQSAELYLYVKNDSESLPVGQGGVNGGSYRVITVNAGDSWDDVYSRYSSQFGGIKSGDLFYQQNYPDVKIVYLDYESQSITPRDDVQMTDKYVFSYVPNENSLKAYLGIAGSEYNMNPYDYYSMYDYFMFDHYNLVVDNTTCRKRSEGGAPTGNEIYVATSTSEVNICAVTEASINNSLSSGYVNAQSYESSSMVTNADARAIIKWNQMLPIGGDAFDNAMANDELTPRATLGATGTGTGTSTPTGGPGDEPENTEEAACYEHAKSLGWVICPVIYGLKEMSEHFYEAITPLLQVNDSVVSQFGSNSSSLYKVWTTFRNIANIIFVIMFMAVILSQLTGYGIDNYGIKRMLPKLIITAILVNISFWLCAIAVDISNILGKTIKEFLEGLAVSSSIGGDSTHAVGYIVQKVVGWIAVASTVTVGVGVAFALEGWAIIVPILLFLLVVVIAIFFALVILGLRQALVVILLVISPLALVCTLLPNTESVFKKWLGTAKSMLMVYPTIGAVIGAGYLTASILMGTDQGFIMTLVAGVLMVGPYFMIPSLTRKALDAVGGIGTRVGNIGRGLGSHARNSIAGSEAVRNARADSREAASARRANRYLNSRRGQATERALRNGDSVSTRRARRYARAQELSQGRNKANLSAYDSMLSSRESENRLNRMQTGGLEAREFAQDMSAQEALLSDQRLTSEDGRAAWEAGLESKALEAAISDQSALFERDGIFDNPARFEQEVQAAAQSNDIAKLQALMRKATNGSDEQRRALRNGFNAAMRSGNVNERTAGTYSSHVTGNSIYKSQDRSLHDQAQAIGRAIANGTYGNGASFTSDNYAGNGIFNGKQASTAAFKFDDAEFDALAAKAASGTAVEKQKIANFMQGALDAKANDTTGQYNDVKPETLDQIRRVLSSSVGSGSVKIDHATQAGSQQIQATQNAAATANAARAAQAGLEAGARAQNQVITDSERASIRDAIDKAERGGGRQTDSGIWLSS